MPTALEPPNPLDTENPYETPLTVPNLPREATVEGRIEDLLAQSSPYMTQARTLGAQTAAKRGLLDSSMGVQASEAAAREAALPIATSDAAVAAQQLLSSQEYGQQLGLASQAGEIEKGLIGYEYEQRGILSAQEAQQAQELVSLEYAERGILSSQEAQQAAQLLADEYVYRGILSEQEAQQALDYLTQQQDFTAAESALAREHELGLIEAEYAERAELSAQEAAQAESLELLGKCLCRSLRFDPARILRRYAAKRTKPGTSQVPGRYGYYSGSRRTP